jgi:hypothetical protein
MIGTALYQFSGNNLALAYYLTVLAIFVLGIIFFYKETYKNNLSKEMNNHE